MVNITGLSVAGQEPFVLHTTETSIVVGLLHPSYTYACEVAAVTSVGQAPYRSLTSQLPEDGMNIWVHTYLSVYVVTDYNNVLQLHRSSAPQHLVVLPLMLHLFWTHSGTKLSVNLS